jgi:DNA-binding MarR family transcriptional regulator
MGPDEIIDLLFENVKHLFFPEDWFQLDLKFSKSEIFSLLLIDKRQEITMTELSEYIHSPMSTSNGIVERLLKKGCVLRGRSESDRRIVVLRLTEEGARFISGFRELISGYLKMALEELSAEEVETLIGIVMKIIRGLRNRTDAGQTPVERPVRNIAIE